MHPLLFSIGPIAIQTYGFMIAVGFILAVLLVKQLSRKSNIDPERMVDFSFWLLVTGFIGARILFVITRWDHFMEMPSTIFKVWEGGLVFFGGFIGAFIFAAWYFKRFKLPFWKTSDVLIPGLVVGHFFGRLGCFAAGCCYGKPTDNNWGMVLNTSFVDQQHRGVPLHPTQLYEAFALFLILVSLLLVFRIKKFDGQVLLTYLLTYPIVRSVIEVFRGDVIRGFVIEDVLSTSQFISILVFVGAGFALFKRIRQLNWSQKAA